MTADGTADEGPNRPPPPDTPAALVVALAIALAVGAVRYTAAVYGLALVAGP